MVKHVLTYVCLPCHCVGYWVQQLSWVMKRLLDFNMKCIYKVVEA